MGLDLHAGSFNAPEALERCHPVLQSDEKWAHAATLTPSFREKLLKCLNTEVPPVFN